MILNGTVRTDRTEPIEPEPDTPSLAYHACGTKKPRPGWQHKCPVGVVTEIRPCWGCYSHRGLNLKTDCPIQIAISLQYLYLKRFWVYPTESFPWSSLTAPRRGIGYSFPRSAALRLGRCTASCTFEMGWPQLWTGIGPKPTDRKVQIIFPNAVGPYN
jgi:hypothetical protein